MSPSIAARFDRIAARFDRIVALIYELQDQLNQAPLPDRLKSKLLSGYSKKILADLIKLFAGDHTEENLYKEIRTYLAENWQLIKGGSLSYTATPKHPVTSILTQLACEVAIQSGEPNVLPILMPGLCLESQHDDFPDLVARSSEEVIHILCTHILSDRQRMLIPVKVLRFVTTNAHQEPVHSPYFNENHPDEFCISPRERERLLAHSSATEALKSKLEDYQTLVSNSRSLLKMLSTLCQKLTNNDFIHSGTHEQSGEGVYSALSAFTDSYNRLDESAKQRIPEELKSEIDLLLQIASNERPAASQGEEHPTCIWIRRSKLSGKMRGHEALLASINIGEWAALSEEIAASQAQFKSSQESLAKSINDGTYNGQECLPVIARAKILSAPEMDFKIMDSVDIELLNTLPEEEMTELLACDHIKKYLIRLLRISSNNWLLFASRLLPEQRSRFFTGLKLSSDDLLLLFQHSSGFLGFVSILEALGSDVLCSIIGSSEGLAILLSQIGSPISLLNVLRDEGLARLINSNKDLDLIFLSSLSSNVKSILFDKLNSPEINDFFKNKLGFCTMIRAGVNGEQFNAVLEAIDPEILRAAISSPEDESVFSLHFSRLNQRNLSKLLNTLSKDALTRLIKRSDDLAIMLTTAQRYGMELKLFEQLDWHTIHSFFKPSYLLLRSIKKSPSLLRPSAMPLPLFEFLFNNKELNADDQQDIYGAKGPYDYYSRIRSEHNIQTPDPQQEKIARRAEFHWYLALLRHEGERLQRQKGEITKKLGADAIALCDALKAADVANIKGLLSQAQSDFKRSPLEQIIDFILKCFDALFLFMTPKAPGFSQHRFFLPRVDDYLTNMSNAHTLAAPNQIQSQSRAL